MSKQERTEKLLIEILNLFADKYGKNAVLSGDMVLRLLDSPKTVSGLEFHFAPYKTVKELKSGILDLLSNLDNTELESTATSKCIRCAIRQKDVVIWIEINVAMSCRKDKLSTIKLAKLYGIEPKVINVMSYDVILSNKLASWYEGRTIKDLYDIYLLLNLGTKPELHTLEERLEQPNFFPRLAARKESLSVAEFYDFIKAEVHDLLFSTVNEEMKEIIPKEELLGLNLKIKNSINENLGSK